MKRRYRQSHVKRREKKGTLEADAYLCPNQKTKVSLLRRDDTEIRRRVRIDIEKLHEEEKTRLEGLILIHRPPELRDRLS